MLFTIKVENKKIFKKHTSTTKTIADLYLDF